MVLKRFLRICAADAFRCSTCLVVASVGEPSENERVSSARLMLTCVLSLRLANTYSFESILP